LSLIFDASIITVNQTYLSHPHLRLLPGHVLNLAIHQPTPTHLLFPVNLFPQTHTVRNPTDTLNSSFYPLPPHQIQVQVLSDHYCISGILSLIQIPIATTLVWAMFLTPLVCKESKRHCCLIFHIPFCLGRIFPQKGEFGLRQRKPQMAVTWEASCA
jgi:hypothetical protein